MKDLSFFPKIYLAREPVDFRKQANGLAAISKGYLEKNPLKEKALFVFTNKRKKSVKAIYWDLTGYEMWVKNLEKDTFKWPSKSGEGRSILLSAKEIKWLLEGVDLSSIKKHKKLEFN